MFVNKLIVQKRGLHFLFFCIPLSRYLVALADDVGLKANTSAKVNLHILTFIPILAPTIILLLRKCFGERVFGRLGADEG